MKYDLYVTHIGETWRIYIYIQYIWLPVPVAWRSGKIWDPHFSTLKTREKKSHLSALGLRFRVSEFSSPSRAFLSLDFPLSPVGPCKTIKVSLISRGNRKSENVSLRPWDMKSKQTKNNVFHLLNYSVKITFLQTRFVIRLKSHNFTVGLKKRNKILKAEFFTLLVLEKWIEMGWSTCQGRCQTGFIFTP